MSSNSIPPYLGTTEPTSSRQPTVSDNTAISAEAPPRSPAPVSTEERSGVGGSSDGQDEQSRIVLLPETGEQPALSSVLSDAPWLNRRRPGSLYSGAPIQVFHLAQCDHAHVIQETTVPLSRKARLKTEVRPHLHVPNIGIRVIVEDSGSDHYKAKH